ncbi:MAG: ATPase, T2SS/T4P/T4SS family [Planctomycetota bacterium]
MDTSRSEKNSCEPKQNAKDVVSLVDDLLNKAKEHGASDIHFEPRSTELDIRFRLDGVLNTVEKLPKSLCDNVIARLKVLGGLLTYRNDIPQEGRIEVKAGQNNQIMDQRLAIFPTIHGQRAVVRLFYNNTELMELEQLGFSERTYCALKSLAAQNQGVLLLTGPAGRPFATYPEVLLRQKRGHARRPGGNPNRGSHAGPDYAAWTDDLSHRAALAAQAGPAGSDDR